jgi:hypothetical protein
LKIYSDTELDNPQTKTYTIYTRIDIKENIQNYKRGRFKSICFLVFLYRIMLILKNQSVVVCNNNRTQAKLYAYHEIAQTLKNFFSPAPQAVGSRRLNTSAKASVLTPRLHQTHLLWELSSMTEASLPRSLVREWLPIFRSGFELRCFQLLSTTAWLPGSALSDNR